MNEEEENDDCRCCFERSRNEEDALTEGDECEENEGEDESCDEEPSDVQETANLVMRLTSALEETGLLDRPQGMVPKKIIVRLRTTNNTSVSHSQEGRPTGQEVSCLTQEVVGRVMDLISGSVGGKEKSQVSLKAVTLSLRSPNWNTMNRVEQECSDQPWRSFPTDDSLMAPESRICSQTQRNAPCQHIRRGSRGTERMATTIAPSERFCPRSQQQNRDAWELQDPEENNDCYTWQFQPSSIMHHNSAEIPSTNACTGQKSPHKEGEGEWRMAAVFGPCETPFSMASQIYSHSLQELDNVQNRTPGQLDIGILECEEDEDRTSSNGISDGVLECEEYEDRQNQASELPNNGFLECEEDDERTSRQRQQCSEHFNPRSPRHQTSPVTTPRREGYYSCDENSSYHSFSSESPDDEPNTWCDANAFQRPPCSARYPSKTSEVRPYDAATSRREQSCTEHVNPQTSPVISPRTEGYLSCDESSSYYSLSSESMDDEPVSCCDTNEFQQLRAYDAAVNNSQEDEDSCAVPALAQNAFESVMMLMSALESDGLVERLEYLLAPHRCIVLSLSASDGTWEDDSNNLACYQSNWNQSCLDISPSDEQSSEPYCTFEILPSYPTQENQPVPKSCDEHIPNQNSVSVWTSEIPCVFPEEEEMPVAKSQEEDETCVKNTLAKNAFEAVMLLMSGLERDGLVERLECLLVPPKRIILSLSAMDGREGGDYTNQRSCDWNNSPFDESSENPSCTFEIAALYQPQDSDYSECSCDEECHDPSPCGMARGTKLPDFHSCGRKLNAIEEEYNAQSTNQSNRNLCNLNISSIEASSDERHLLDCSESYHSQESHSEENNCLRDRFPVHSNIIEYPRSPSADKNYNKKEGFTTTQPSNKTCTRLSPSVVSPVDKSSNEPCISVEITFQSKESDSCYSNSINDIDDDLFDQPPSKICKRTSKEPSPSFGRDKFENIWNAGSSDDEMDINKKNSNKVIDDCASWLKRLSSSSRDQKQDQLQSVQQPFPPKAVSSIIDCFSAMSNDSNTHLSSWHKLSFQILPVAEQAVEPWCTSTIAISCNSQESICTISSYEENIIDKPPIGDRALKMPCGSLGKPIYNTGIKRPTQGNKNSRKKPNLCNCKRHSIAKRKQQPTDLVEECTKWLETLISSCIANIERIQFCERSTDPIKPCESATSSLVVSTRRSSIPPSIKSSKLKKKKRDCAKHSLEKTRNLNRMVEELASWMEQRISSYCTEIKDIQMCEISADCTPPCGVPKNDMFGNLTSKNSISRRSRNSLDRPGSSSCFDSKPNTDWPNFCTCCKHALAQPATENAGKRFSVMEFCRSSSSTDLEDYC